MKDILLIGAARSGIAAARLLAKQGFHPVLTDMKSIENKEDLEAMGIEVCDNGHPDFLKERDWDFIVKNPGIPYHAPLIAHFQQKGLPIYTEIETAFRAGGEAIEYGAVTGTDGKTTITTLLYEMLKADDAIENPRVAGNIGIPLSEVVDELNGAPSTVALELSNFQLLGIESFRPKVSVISNLAPDHLDYMDSLDAYYRSKFRIFENCDESDFFILNVDDPLIVQYAASIDIPCKVVTFSLSDPKAGLHLADGKAMLGDLELFDAVDLKLVGSFNLGNAMMAAAMAYFLGVSLQAIEQVIQTFPGVEHRIEYVDTINGVRIYNDSKATNTHSASAALSSFDGHVRLLAGGKNKGIDYTVLSTFDQVVEKCYSFGEIKDVFGDIFSNVQTLDTMEQALDAALADSQPGDVILLCPATSSFDQFKNYEVRGEIFKDLVRQRSSSR